MPQDKDGDMPPPFALTHVARKHVRTLAATGHAARWHDIRFNRGFIQMHRDLVARLLSISDIDGVPLRFPEEPARVGLERGEIAVISTIADGAGCTHLLTAELLRDT